MKLQIFNISDTDIQLTHTRLKISAETAKEMKQLEGFEDEIHATHLAAIKAGIAGIGNAVGSSSRSEGTDSIVFDVRLGGDIPFSKVKRDALAHLRHATKLIEELTK